MLPFVFTSKEIVHGDDGGWLMQPGVWTDHSSYSHAGNQALSADISVAKVPGVAEDSSHAHRRPLWLTSLAEAYPTDSPEHIYYESLLQGLRVQFLNKVLISPSQEFPSYRTTNFMDRHNGVYRWNYPTHPNDGYAPYELSGTLHLGSWTFLDTPQVRDVYRQIGNHFLFGPETLDTFVGPGTLGLQYPEVDWPVDYQPGFYELTSRLAGNFLAGSRRLSIYRTKSCRRMAGR